MVNRRFIAIAGLILALGLAYWFFIYNSDERRIRKQFERVSEWFVKEPDASGLVLATRVGLLKSLIAEECVLNLDAYGVSETYSPDTIANYALGVLAEATQLELDLYDISMNIQSSSSARVALTARLIWETTSGERLTDTHELECVLNKHDDTWRFMSVDIIDVLEK